MPDFSGMTAWNTRKLGKHARQQMEQSAQEVNAQNTLLYNIAQNIFLVHELLQEQNALLRELVQNQRR